jgi:hypothetical protein
MNGRGERSVFASVEKALGRVDGECSWNCIAGKNIREMVLLLLSI